MNLRRLFASLEINLWHKKITSVFLFEHFMLVCCEITLSCSKCDFYISPSVLSCLQCNMCYLFLSLVSFLCEPCVHLAGKVAFKSFVCVCVCVCTCTLTFILSLMFLSMLIVLWSWKLNALSLSPNMKKRHSNQECCSVYKLVVH